MPGTKFLADQCKANVENWKNNVETEEDKKVYSKTKPRVAKKKGDDSDDIDIDDFVTEPPSLK